MHSSKWLVVTVTGITGGGKSELSTFLYKHLPDSSRLLRQDKYFLPEDSPKHVKCSGNIDHLNWDIINCIDMDEMYKDIRKVLDNPPTSVREEICYTNMTLADGDNNTKKIGTWKKKNVAAEKESEVNDNVGTSTPQATAEVKQQCDEVVTSSKDFGKKPTNADGENDKNHRPVLILDGFTLLDDPRFIELSDQVYFFHLTKEECFRRRELRNFDPPDVPGYFDKCVYPMYEEYKARCETEYSKGINVQMLDGAGQQKVIYSEILSKVKKAANLV